MVSGRQRVFIIGVTLEDAERLRARATAPDTHEVLGMARMTDVQRGLVTVPTGIDVVLVSPAALGPAPAPAPDPATSLVESLTPRELTVLGLVADGLPNRDIAAALELSEHTVKFHLASIFGKLGVSSRTEAVRRGLRLGLIDL